MDIINKEHSEKMKLGHMSSKTNTKKLFTPLESPQKNDVYRHIRDSENSKTTLSKCMHGTICKQFQSSSIQGKKKLKMQHTAPKKDLEKWCTLHCFEQQQNRGCNIFKQRRQG
jgi:hypothetical protein